MAYITIGEEHTFGLSEPLPPKGFPDGRIRWRIREDDFILARVETADGIREFYVKEQDGYWVPSYEKGRNSTANAGADAPATG